MKLLLVILISLIIFIIVLLLIAQKKIRELLLKYFGTSDLKQAIEKSELTAENTPKSLSSMESLYLYKIHDDFPELNINELKSMAESNIINCLSCIENNNIDLINNSNEKIKSYVKSKIQDNDSKSVSYSDINIHQTVVNKYEKNVGIATIFFETGLDYKYKCNNNAYRKIQDRYKTEFIYIIDEDKVNSNQKAIGLNCANCGAPVKSVGEKTCYYCGSGVSDIVKRTWSLNNIKSY